MKKIGICILLLLSMFVGINTAHTSSLDFEVTEQSSQENLKTGQSNSQKEAQLEKIQSFGESEDNFWSISIAGEKGTKQFLVRIAKDMKNLLFLVASLYFFFIIIRLLFSENTEEESENFKKGLLWITLGIVITQVSFSVVRLLFDQGIGGGLAFHFVDNIIEPVVAILKTATSFFFVAVAIFAFYKMITSNGDDEAVSQTKNTVIYAIVGFIVVRFATALTQATYGRLDCDITDGYGAVISGRDNCIQDADLSGVARIITTVIDWANGFIGIIVVIMIIYVGAQVLFSAGNEDKLKNAKSAIIYIAIGIALLFLNFLIISFFITPEAPILINTNI